MDIYPTHRTAAAPQWVYDNIFRNATRARAASGGISYGVEGAAGGIPFPIPKNGFEVVWNHLLAFWGPARETHLSTYVMSSDGNLELTSAYQEIADFPYYYPNATAEGIGPYYLERREITVGPPERVGESYVALQPLNVARDKFTAW